MNCQSFRKYVGAFADGELDTPLNVESLEHLNMCPACAQKVERVHQLKTSLRRTMETEVAPAELADKIKNAIRCEALTPAPGHHHRGPLIYRLLVPAGIAAALLVTAMIWQWQQAPGTTPVTGITSAIRTRFPAEVRNQHTQCAHHGYKHHDASLGRDLLGIASKLTNRLKLTVLAPDLSASGFSLVGADQCGVMDRNGAHVLYTNQSGQILSVFSVAVADCRSMIFGEQTKLENIDYSVDQQDKLAVVSWSEGCAAYVFCADIAADSLLELAQNTRVSDTPGK